MFDYFHHLFIPRESNRHRARLLHFQPLLLFIAFLLALSVVIPYVESTHPDVLGISVNISSDELINLTNQKRSEAGLPPLTISPELSQAAAFKASDMLAKNYWAHNAPDGTTPWYFIKSAGYDYLYAGENLARGYTSAQEAVSAWMASPGHRDNILSSNYQEVGFAVLTGMLAGDDTVLIVQEFGRREVRPAVNIAQNPVSPVPTIPVIPSVTAQPVLIAEVKPTIEVKPTVIVSISPTITPQQFAYAKHENPDQPLYIASVNRKPLINKNSFTKNIALVTASLFIFLLALDLVIVERKKIVRIMSHSTDHFLFLSVILVVILIYNKGLIL